jgi:Mg2+-importing ATPase
LVELAAIPAEQVAARLDCSTDGLTTSEAAARTARYGPNALPRGGHTLFRIIFRQLNNPLLALLLAATLVSVSVGETTDAAIIIAIVFLSVALGFFDEYRADVAVRALESNLTTTARVRRDGKVGRVPAESVVPGDLLVLDTGDILVADARLVDALDLSADEAVLTGESLPAEKSAGPVTEEEPLASVVLTGSVLRSGRGTALVVATGSQTLFGQVAAKVEAAPQTTEFQRGLRRFSLFLIAVTAVLTVFIFAANALLDHGVIEALLFSLAIAVGLTPQLLPAIVTVSLSLGARRLAQQKVIVRHLVAIEDLGNIEVLFSDKTGTLTEGNIVLQDAVGPGHDGGAAVLEWAAAWLGAGAHELSTNALDAALAADDRVRAAAAARGGWAVVGELPFSFQRRSAALLLQGPGGERRLVVKGAAEEVLERCQAGSAWGEEWQTKATSALHELLDHGARVLAVALKTDDGSAMEAQAGGGLDLVGFLAFSDPPKVAAKAALARLAALNVEVKILTGDHPAVAKYVCEQLDIGFRGAVTGADLTDLNPSALTDLVRNNTVFARVSPEQKAALVAAAQHLGRDVGFLGDGVNDAPALRQADVGISVDDATDVAKAAADVVLLEKDLGVLAAGIEEGRRTFANTVKYVMMATSSNFGNMFSAAGASLFLSFLPMRPTQILLNNFLYDVSELTLPTDRVDEELTRRPAHWDVGLIFRFMLVFGPASSAYDFLTFAVMLKVFHAHESLFQAGWFVESFCTQTLVIFLLRTQRIPFWRSRPSRPLLITTIVCVCIAIAIPYSPMADVLGFERLPLRFFLALAGMVTTYLLLVEAAKRFFFRRWPSLTGQDAAGPPVISPAGANET